VLHSPYAWTPLIRNAHARIYTHGIAVGQYQVLCWCQCPTAFDAVSTYWNVHLPLNTQVNVPSKNYNERVHTVLDSGSVLTYMEDEALADLHRELRTYCQQGANPACENATKGSTGYKVIGTSDCPFVCVR